MRVTSSVLFVVSLLGCGSSDPCGPNDDGKPIADGLVRCPDGVVNRVAPGTFDPSVPSANSCKGDEPKLQCVTDSECNAKPYGACVHGLAQEVGEQCIPKCSCVYACASDADCEPDEACIPPEVHDYLNPWPQCQPASCRDADDCEEGECGVGYEVLGYCGEDAAPLGCRTADDECRTSEDCEAGYECQPGPDRWACGISHSE
jgi:hypothetical protein